MSEYYKFIHSIDELKYFYNNVLPPLKETEVYFVSLSARNKYLTDIEKEELDLGRTEMFCKSIIRKNEWNRFLRTIRKFECHKEGYTTRTGASIPEKAIVCYININPSSTPRTIQTFKQVMAEYDTELISIALGDRQNTSNIAQRLNKIDNNLYTCFQNSGGIKHWIDIDMDVNKEYKPFNRVSSVFLLEKGITNFHWIDTKSGYHLLIKRDELKFNPQIICDYFINDYVHSLPTKCFDTKFEIVLNKNYMIPLPGTFQGGYPVTILNKA